MTEIKRFEDMMPHDDACFIIGLIAEHLDIEIPTDPKMIRFFFSRLKETVLYHKKQAAAYGVLVKALDSAVHGR